MKIFHISRNGLYFDKYALKLTIYLRNSRAMVNYNLGRPNKALWGRDDEFYHLYVFNDIFNQDLSDHKQVVRAFALYFYSNSMPDIERITKHIETKQVSCIYDVTCVDFVYEKNQVYLHEPKFSQRSYLNNMKITHTQREALMNFFNDNQDLCKPSKTVRQIIKGQHRWRKQRFMKTDFVDHDFSCQDKVFLNIIVPGLFGLTKKICAK